MVDKVHPWWSIHGWNPNQATPSKIEATYTTTSGETKTSLLLTSGWWGLARHFHYVPEILAAFFWTVPALFNHFLPYFYVVFLTILLFDRAKRDDDRCRSKYGKYWKLYCNKVPYKIIPGIYWEMDVWGIQCTACILLAMCFVTSSPLQIANETPFGLFLSVED